MKLVLYFLDTSEKIFEGMGKKERDNLLHLSTEHSWQLVSVAKWQYLPPKNEDLAVSSFYLGHLAVKPK